jgi:hypothetical protein
MQLELELAELPAAAQALWEQLDPAHQEAAIQRLAMALASVVTSDRAEDDDDE